MNFWKKSICDDKSIAELENSLCQFADVDLNVVDSSNLKRRLLIAAERNVRDEFLPFSLKRLVVAIQNIGQKTLPSLSASLKLKNKLMDFIEYTAPVGFTGSVFGGFRYFQTIFASVLLFLFVLTGVFLPLRVPITHAARSNYFEEVTGNVFVLRSGQLLKAGQNFTLQASDVIVTKENSFASVRFFDDSVSRLDSNTQLELKRLYTEPLNPIATQVELLLQEGSLWSRVLNLVDENSLFKVETAKVSTTVSKKATFNLSAHFYETTLAVFDNMVDFAFVDDFSSGRKSVLAGFKTHVSSDGAVRTSLINDENEANGKISDWVEVNLKLDKIHNDKVAQEKTNALTALVPSPDLPKQTLSPPKEKVFTNHEIEKLRLQFLDAEKRFLLGETFLTRDHGEVGLKLISEFKNTVKTITLRLKDFEKIDLLNSGLLRSMIESKVGKLRKDLATLLPGDALYLVKEIVNETELLLANSYVDRTAMRLSQLMDMLLDVQELIKRARLDEAAKVLHAYERHIERLVLQISDENLDEFNNKFISLFNQQITQIKALTSIEKSLYKMQDKLLPVVQSLRHAMLQKILVVSQDTEGMLPVDLLRQLKDLLQTYVTDGAYDKEFVSILNKLLNKRSENESTSDKNENSVGKTDARALPEKVGLVKLVDEMPESPKDDEFME